jgi:hypothetical protein
VVVVAAGSLRQSIGTGVAAVAPDVYFELTARQTSGRTKNVANELTKVRHRGGAVAAYAPFFGAFGALPSDRPIG